MRKEYYMNDKFDTPILFIVFNRPDTTKVVFECIRKLRPTKLFVAADGPRKGHPTDAEDCRLTREVVSNINWPCEVRILFREKNLGCRVAPPQAVSWFFQNVDRGIVIEDDCVPEQSFFYFCKELLLKFENNEKVMHISGNNYQRNNKNFNNSRSYYFSQIPQMWGWASWKRAWQFYDIDMKDWPRYRDAKKIFNIFIDNTAVGVMFTELLERYYNGKNSWDGQWIFAIFKNNGICINPNLNLVKNIGFDDRATHTKNEDGEFSQIATNRVSFPLIHPDKIGVDRAADDYTYKNQFSVNKNLATKIKFLLKYKFKNSYTFIKDVLIWVHNLK